jgi:hypothetical protein
MVGENPLVPQDFDGGLQVLPSVLLRGPPQVSSVLVQVVVCHLLLVDCSDLLYVFWVKVRELHGRSGLRIDHGLKGQGAHAEHLLSVRCLAAVGGQADTSGETPPQDDLSWRRVVLDGQLLNERVFANEATTCIRYVNSALRRVVGLLACGSVCADVDTFPVAEVKKILLGEVRVHSVKE